MNSDPLVSVIITSFNSEKWIREAIDSVFDQTYPKREVIVVDDGSTDDTLSLVQPMRDRIRFLHQANSGGLAGPRNRGLQLAHGEYVCLLDADDVMHPKRIEHQVRLLQEYESVGAVFGDYLNVTEAGSYPHTHFESCPELQDSMAAHGENGKLILTPVECRRILSAKNFSIPSTLMFRKNVVTKVGHFSEDLKRCEDFDFHFRIARQFAVGILDEIVVYRRIHKENLIHDKSIMASMSLTCRKNLLRDEVDSVTRVRLKHYIAEVQLELGNMLSGQNNFRSLFHTLDSVRYRHPFQYPFFRNITKGCLSLLRFR
ncbi:MAG: glycosyltransferase [Planctomycetota bacterium]|nr:glycosyltransferase [Planctomycetota bacterium]MDA1214827.1 glycosyltransferase [Planctomycetota bacterium]